MTRKTQYLAILIAILGLISILVGAGFVGVAVQKNTMITDLLKEQKVTVGLTQAQIAAGEIVDNPAKVQAASNTIAEHLKKIAPSYTALMAAGKTGKYDPTNIQQLDYAQGMNIQNTLNLVILSYGVIQETIAIGIVLIVIGLGIGITGLVLLRLFKRTAPPVTA